MDSFKTNVKNNKILLTNRNLWKELLIITLINFSTDCVAYININK